MNENYIRPLQIGRVRLDNNLIMAPMAGVTDYPFRLMTKLFGVGLTVSEMVHVTAMTFKSKTTPVLTKRSAIEKPYCIQLFGNLPEHFSNSVRYISRYEMAELIDINMGCPAKKVVSSKSGVYLMKNVENAKKIITTAVKTASEFPDRRIPITVKIRLGWDLNSITAVDFCKMIEDCGAEMITVHARTQCMRFSGTPLYEWIARCKEAVRIPVIANGDINVFSSVKRVMDETGADGVMIGRAAMGRPWIFRDIINEAEGKRRLDFKIPDVIKLMKYHGRLVGAFYSEINGVESFRKQLLWYTKGWYGSAQLRENLKVVASADDIDARLDMYLQSLEHLELPETKLFNVYEN